MKRNLPQTARGDVVQGPLTLEPHEGALLAEAISAQRTCAYTGGRSSCSSRCQRVSTRRGWTSGSAAGARGGPGDLDPSGSLVGLGTYGAVGFARTAYITTIVTLATRL